jgi:hypothetical protein
MIRSIINLDKHMTVDPTGMSERLSGMMFRSRMRGSQLLATGHVNRVIQIA